MQSRNAYRPSVRVVRYYEQNPDVSTNGHPNSGTPILREHGVDEEIIRAILSHATEVTGVERESKMELTLYAADELTGLIAAVALVCPSKDIRDVKLKLVKKKWKPELKHWAFR